MTFLATPVLSMLRRRHPNYYFHPVSVARGSEILSNLNVRKPHVAIMPKKAYAKIAALRRIKRLVPSYVIISLYKAYVLPHLEYCCPLLLGISKALKYNMERTNHYAIKTLLNLGNSATYDVCLAMAAMDTLEQRSTLILFFKCFKLRKSKVSKYISVSVGA